MAIQQRALMETLRSEVEEIEEAYPGYRADLLDHLSQIVFLEREHQQRSTQIQKKVSDRCQALGQLLVRNDWKP